MPDEAFNCRQTWVDLLLILLTFTEVYYCVYTIKNFTSEKLKQNLGSLSWKHGQSLITELSRKFNTSRIPVYSSMSSCRPSLSANNPEWAILPPHLYQNWEGCFSICYVRMPSISKTDCCADRSILALPSAYQEHLVTFKSNSPRKWSKVGNEKF